MSTKAGLLRMAADASHLAIKGPVAESFATVLREAADEIDKQEDRIAELEAENQRLRDALKGLMRSGGREWQEMILALLQEGKPHE